MGIEIDATAHKRVDLVGREISSESTETVHVHCDGPNCKTKCAYHDGDMVWKITDDSPDQFYRTFIVSIGRGSQMSFFSDRCLRDWLKAYTPGFSPKELEKMKPEVQTKKEEPPTPETPPVFTVTSGAPPGTVSPTDGLPTVYSQVVPPVPPPSQSLDGPPAPQRNEFSMEHGDAISSAI